MREIQIIIAIVNNHNKIAKPVDTQFQPTFKMETNLNKSHQIKTAEQILHTQDPEA